MARGGGNVTYIPQPNAPPPNALQIGGAALADFANTLVQLDANQRAKALDALRERALGQQVQAGAMDLAKARAEQSGQIDAALSALGIGAPQPQANTVNPILQQLASQFANPAQLTPLPIAPVTPGTQAAPSPVGAGMSPTSAAQIRANPETQGAIAALGDARTASIDANARLARVGIEAQRLGAQDKMLRSFPEQYRGPLSLMLQLQQQGIPADVTSSIWRSLPDAPRGLLEQLQLTATQEEVTSLLRKNRNAATIEQADRIATGALVSAGILPRGIEYMEGAAERLSAWEIASRNIRENKRAATPSTQQVLSQLFRDLSGTGRSEQVPVRNFAGIPIGADGTPAGPGNPAVTESRRVPLTPEEAWQNTLEIGRQLLGDDAVNTAIHARGGIPRELNSAELPVSLGGDPDAATDIAKAQAVAQAQRAAGRSATEIEAMIYEALKADGNHDVYARNIARRAATQAGTTSTRGGRN